MFPLTYPIGELLTQECPSGPMLTVHIDSVDHLPKRIQIYPKGPKEQTVLGQHLRRKIFTQDILSFPTVEDLLISKITDACSTSKGNKLQVHIVPPCHFFSYSELKVR